MSHEIRTPLGAVLGFSDLLLAGNKSPSEQADFAAAIKRNGDQLLLLVDDLLDISKIEAGRFDVERSRVSLDEICTDFNSLMHYRARAKNMTFHFERIGPLPDIISTDSRRLRQILINIVGNAIKFTDEGGEVHVTVELRNQTKPVLIFTIRDTGIGISKEDAARLFQPFTQADVSHSRKYGGTGLGLALSRRLARALGGDVTLKESSKDRGSTFVVELYPGEIAPESLREHPALTEFHLPPPTVLQEKAVDKLAENVDLTGVRILLVDDSMDNRALISRILRGKGAIVELANDGLEGVDKALHGEFDLVLMDIQMPNMDGFEAIRKLHGVGYSVPIVAVTAHAMTEDRERCLDLGFADHLTKPVNKLKLFDLVQRVGTLE